MLRIADQAPEKWKPKQCIEATTAVFSEMAGNGSQKIAKHIISSLAPFSPGSVIHDNACGKGIVAKEIVALPPKNTQDMSVYATDLAPAMVEECQALAAEKGWIAPPKELKSELMAMQDLTFPDETFSHSITNFAIFALPDNEAVRAASHIRRTLRKGGVAIISLWAESPIAETLQYVHNTTRSRTDCLPLFTRLYWQEALHIKKVLMEAGFEEDRIKMRQEEVYVDIADLERWSQIAWTLAGRPAEGWQEGDEERWGDATAMLREGVRKSKGFRVDEDGSHIRCMVNIAIAEK